MPTILIVEDNLPLSRSIREYLGNTYKVFMATTVADGLQLVYNRLPDLLILDLSLPDSNGLELLTKLRARLHDLPVIILSSNSSIDEICKGLIAGADDYICKPFSIRELKARIDRMLKRPPVSSRGSQEIQDLQLDAGTFSLVRGRQRLQLRKLEFAIIGYLSKNRDIAVTREQLLANVWKDKREPYSGTIDVHISNIRRKVRSVFRKDLIRTVHGFGYQVDSRSL